MLSEHRFWLLLIVYLPVLRIMIKYSKQNSRRFRALVYFSVSNQVRRMLLCLGVHITCISRSGDARSYPLSSQHLVIIISYGRTTTAVKLSLEFSPLTSRSRCVNWARSDEMGGHWGCTSKSCGTEAWTLHFLGRFSSPRPSYIEQIIVGN